MFSDKQKQSFPTHTMQRVPGAEENGLRWEETVETTAMGIKGGQITSYRDA